MKYLYLIAGHAKDAVIKLIQTFNGHVKDRTNAVLS